MLDASKTISFLQYIRVFDSSFRKNGMTVILLKQHKQIDIDSIHDKHRKSNITCMNECEYHFDPYEWKLLFIIECDNQNYYFSTIVSLTLGITQHVTGTMYMRI